MEYCAINGFGVGAVVCWASLGWVGWLGWLGGRVMGGFSVWSGSLVCLFDLLAGGLFKSGVP